LFGYFFGFFGKCAADVDVTMVNYGLLCNSGVLIAKDFYEQIFA